LLTSNTILHQFTKQYSVVNSIKRFT